MNQIEIQSLRVLQYSRPPGALSLSDPLYPFGPHLISDKFHIAGMFQCPQPCDRDAMPPNTDSLPILNF